MPQEIWLYIPICRFCVLARKNCVASRSISLLSHFCNDTSVQSKSSSKQYFILHQTFFVVQTKMKCPTCFEVLISDSKNYIVTTPCGHLFHNDCVQAWLDRGNQSCPQCRTKLKREKLIRLYSFETTIEAQISHETNLNKQKSQSCSILYAKAADSINFQDQDLNLQEDPFEGHHRGNSSTPPPSEALAPLDPLDSSNLSNSLEIDEDYLGSGIVM